MVTIALAKGRLADKTIEILKKAGIDTGNLDKKSRKLIFKSNDNSIEYILVKPSDVPTYVDYGAADIGIVGKDTLLEEKRPLYELLDLKFAKCYMAVAGYPGEERLRITSAHTKVATKYINIASDYFAKKDKEIEIIKLNGSVELGPITGLSDVIVDIVESGRTLKENGLVVLEKICDISARLVVNRVSLKIKSDEIKHIVSSVEKVLEGEND